MLAICESIYYNTYNIVKSGEYMTKYLIAHDLGTTGNKATLFDSDGNLINSVVSAYKTNFFNSTWAEQDPDDWVNAVYETNKILLKDIDSSKVCALAFSGQMMGCVVVDENGNHLRPAIIWADQRSIEEEKFIRSKIDEKEFYKITGHKISASYSIEKLMWIKNNEPEIFNKTYKMLQPKDYIIHKLTGKFVTDFSDASGTNAFDLNTFKWSDKILDIINIDKSLLPDIYDSTHIAGEIDELASKTSNLPVGTKIVIGGGDGVCAAVGAGSVKENVFFNYLGSSSWIAYTSKTPVYDENMRTYNWAHLIKGYVTPNGTMQAAGNSYNFLKDLLYENQDNIYEKLDHAISSSKVGANGLIYLPYLLGERSPRWNSLARGAYIGMKMEHQKGDFIRSGVEGILMNLCLILDIFKKDLDIKSINIIGGLSQSEEICKILANIYGINAHRLNYLEEATSIGAAVCAGVGAGVLSSFLEIDKFIKVDNITEFDKTQNQKYDAVKEVFDKSYYSLIEIYEKLDKI